jgi:hypothetical protein
LQHLLDVANFRSVTPHTCAQRNGSGRQQTAMQPVSIDTVS